MISTVNEQIHEAYVSTSTEELVDLLVRATIDYATYTPSDPHCFVSPETARRYAVIEAIRSELRRRLRTREI